MSHPGQFATKGDVGEGNVLSKYLDDEEKQDQSHPARDKPSTGEEQKEHAERACPRKFTRPRGKERTG